MEKATLSVSGSGPREPDRSDIFKDEQKNIMFLPYTGDSLVSPDCYNSAERLYIDTISEWNF